MRTKGKHKSNHRQYPAVQKHNGNVSQISLLWFLRTYYGYKQYELAKETGLTANVISRFERGLRGISIGRLKILSDFLQIPMQALYDNDYSVLFSALASSGQNTLSLRDRIHQRQQITEKIGDIGEAWVLALETQKLAGTEYADWVNPNFADDPDAHFDILSFDEKSGEPIRIEVKTTSRDANTRFFLSEDEMTLLKHCAENSIPYELHRVFYCKDPARRGRVIFTAQEVLEQFDITPTTFRLEMKKEVNQ